MGSFRLNVLFKDTQIISNVVKPTTYSMCLKAIKETRQQITALNFTRSLLGSENFYKLFH